MSTQNAHADTSSAAPPLSTPVTRVTGAALLTALGVVYGDIGTSPLYAFKSALDALGGAVDAPHVLGILSMIFWSLTLVVSLKYIVFVLRADNEGEGGILAFFGLLSPQGRSGGRGQKRPFVMLLILFGCAMLFGDGVITPAISVLSAVEGIKTVIPSLDKTIILAVTCGILIALFAIQRQGTERIGRVFGPVMLVWFLMCGSLGIWHIAGNPSVLAAMNPSHAVRFMIAEPTVAFVVLGAVFLCLTGGEAMYADLGHCGQRPIRNAWFLIVLPGVMLNYFGQGALVIATPAAASSPFFLLGPDLMRIPFVVLATAATVIASQALISGVFSLVRQSITLGISPRFAVEQTSAHEFGQVYLPSVNWALMVGACVLVLAFGTSDSMAAAYGIAVVMTMLITTALICLVMRLNWGWNLAWVGAFGSMFLSIDLMFTVSNMLKIADGGWVPLSIGAVAFLAMLTWSRGQELLKADLTSRAVPKDRICAELGSGLIRRTPGTAVFLTKTEAGLPPILCEFVAKTHSAAETVVIMNLRTTRLPFLHRKDNIAVEDLGDGFFRVNARYGYKQPQRIMAAIEEARRLGVTMGKAHDSTIVVGHETLTRKAKGSAMWRISAIAFTWMLRNGATADQFFCIPKGQVLEVGIQVEV